MSTRALSVLVAVLAACAVLVVVLAGSGDDDGGAKDAAPKTAPLSPLARALKPIGGGAAGGTAVALTQWRYRADPRDRGRRLRWRRGGFGGRTVSLPHSPNGATVQGPRAARSYAGSIGWYSRKVQVPVRGLYAIAFESAHHRATVYVDGRSVRSHVGAYEPFAARAKLTPGEHTIVVRVDWRSPARQTAEGWGRAWFNYGGLNRPVTMARLGASEIGALTVGTRLREGNARVRVGVRVRNRGPRARLRLRGTLTRGGRTVRLRFQSRTVARRTSASVTATATVRDPELWSPDDPALYRLTVEATGSARIDRDVGLRELGWKGGTLRLNGRPLVLHGAALPPDARGRGDAMTEADEARAVAQLKAVGANATRSQLPLSRTMLGRLDAAGILVWQEVGPWEPAGAWRARTPDRIQAARVRALRTAEDQQAHPSILTWTLTNEAAGAGQASQQAYVAQTAAALHEMDTTRPVSADLWGRQVTRTGGALFDAVDALGVTDYVGWYENVDDSPERQAAVAAERIARLRKLFPRKPVVVTELGAVGTHRVPNFEFGGLRFQAGLLAGRLKGLSEVRDLSGTLVWSLRDYALRPDFRGGSVLKLRPDLDLTPGLNEKGLYDFAGRAKPSLAAVRDAFATGGGG